MKVVYTFSSPNKDFEEKTYSHGLFTINISNSQGHHAPIFSKGAKCAQHTFKAIYLLSVFKSSQKSLRELQLQQHLIDI